jgi:hypothetical protein
MKKTPLAFLVLAASGAVKKYSDVLSASLHFYDYKNHRNHLLLTHTRLHGFKEEIIML